MEYFISNNGKAQEGPFTFQEITKKFNQDEFSSDSLFWRQGLKDWVHADDIPELKELLQNLPPPLDDSQEKETPPPLSVKAETHRDKSSTSNGNNHSSQEASNRDRVQSRKSDKNRLVFDEDGLYKFTLNAFLPTAEFIGTDFGFVILYRVFIFGVPLSVLLWWALGRPEELPNIAYSLIPIAPIVLSTIFKRARGLKGKMFGWISIVVLTTSLYMGGPILGGLFMIYLRFARPNSLDKGGYHCLKASLDINEWTTTNDRGVLLQLIREESSFRREQGIPRHVALSPYRVGLHNEVKTPSPAEENRIFSWVFSTNGRLYDGHHWNELTSEEKRSAETFNDGNEELKSDLLRLRECLANGQFIVEKSGVEYEVRDLDGVVKFFGLKGESREKIIEGLSHGNSIRGPLANGWHCRRADSSNKN